MNTYMHYIDGTFVPASSGKTFESFNPYTGEAWASIARAVSYTSPFGGYKRSGLGRESGINAIYEFLQTKSVWISTQTSPQNPFVIR